MTISIMPPYFSAVQDNSSFPCHPSKAMEQEQIHQEQIIGDPVEFESPRIGNAELLDDDYVKVYDPFTCTYYDATKLLFSIDSNNNKAKRAYWIQNMIRQAIYGCVVPC